jgi:hypothetical protein
MVSMRGNFLLPSWYRRGGRDPQKDVAKPPLMERTGWSGPPKHFGVSDHPVCGAKVGLLLLDAAATPPVPGGELLTDKQTMDIEN